MTRRPGPGDPTDDLALVRAVVAREPGAYERLMGRCGRVVRSCLASTTAAAPWLRRHEADLLQAFELMLVDTDFEVLRSYSGQAALTTWIHVVATRFFRRRAGAIHAAESRAAAAQGPGEPPPAGPSAEAAYLESERIERLRAAVRELPAEDRALLAMFYEQGLDASAIAPLLGPTPSGVRMRKARLLAALARRLRDLVDGR